MHFPASLRLDEMRQGFGDYSPLKFYMEGGAEVMPHHEWDEYGARRLRMFRDIKRDAD